MIYRGFPEYLEAAAAEVIEPDSRDEAIRVARAQPAISQLSSLIDQSLGHPSPPDDTVRRAREIAEGLAVAAVAAGRMVELIDPGFHQSPEPKPSPDEPPPKLPPDEPPPKPPVEGEQQPKLPPDGVPPKPPADEPPPKLPENPLA